MTGIRILPNPEINRKVIRRAHFDQIVGWLSIVFRIRDNSDGQILDQDSVVPPASPGDLHVVSIENAPNERTLKDDVAVMPIVPKKELGHALSERVMGMSGGCKLTKGRSPHARRFSVSTSSATISSNDTDGAHPVALRSFDESPTRFLGVDFVTNARRSST